MGSTRLVRGRLAGSGERFVPFVLDPCGHDPEVRGLERALAIVGLESDSGSRDFFDEIANADDTLLLNLRALPSVFWSCGEWEHDLMPSDTLERLDPAETTAVARFLERFARACATRVPAKPGLRKRRRDSVAGFAVARARRSHGACRRRLPEFGQRRARISTRCGRCCEAVP